jgi:pyridoxamine 5'-phosphate oxidase
MADHAPSVNPGGVVTESLPGHLLRPIHPWPCPQRSMSIKSSIKTVLTLGQGVVAGLPEAAEDADPIELFRSWFDAAGESGILLPESVALATATPDGVPSVRMVLLKGLDQRGFVFFTNYGSRKASELDSNPHAALCFHWAVHQRQARVSGAVVRISEEENAAYFETRGRGSKLGAWASKQSEPLDERAELETRMRDAQNRFPGDDVPLPPFWGGYRIVPETIEFWQGRADRLHDRLVFSRAGEGWETVRLYP